MSFVSTLIFLQAPLNYKAWADRRTLDAVAQIDAAQYPSAFAFACQQLNHMVRVEELFRARWMAAPDPHDATNTEALPPLQDLDRRLMMLNQWWLGDAQALRPEQAEERLHFTFTDGKRGMLTRAEMIYHVINHGTYHRGAIGHALDLAHAPRPADTYTVFIHTVEPERREAAL